MNMRGFVVPVNQIRAVLIEQGIAVGTGTRALCQSLFPTPERRAPPRTTDLIAGLYEDWLWNERIETVTKEIEQHGHTSTFGSET